MLALTFFSGKMAHSSSRPTTLFLLRLINLHIVDDGPPKGCPATDAVELPLIHCGSGEED